MVCSLYWRMLTATLIVFSLVLVGVLTFDIFSLIPNTDYYPTVFWLLCASVGLVFELLLSNGLVSAIWGSRTGIKSQDWWYVRLAFIALFFVLAALAFTVEHLTSRRIWSLYKLYCQPSFLLLWPVFIGTLFTRKIAR